MSSGNDSGAHEDLLAQQAAFFESYFKKGAEFTRELMQETQRLRARLAEVEERLSDGDRDKELEERYQQIERENNDLAALYVAQSQLHSTLDTREVVQVITEILLNFVGADRFALMLLDGNEVLRVIRSMGIDAELVGDIAAHASIAKVLKQGGVLTSGLDERSCAEEPVSLIALRGSAGSFGLISIWGYLKQKQEISDLDQQIFDLIAVNGGLALEASRLVGEARTRGQIDASGGPFERLSRLL